MTSAITALALDCLQKARTSAALMAAGHSVGAALALVFLSAFSPETC